jgi:hypothetical protein
MKFAEGDQHPDSRVSGDLVVLRLACIWWVIARESQCFLPSRSDPFLGMIVTSVWGKASTQPGVLAVPLVGLFNGLHQQVTATHVSRWLGPSCDVVGAGHCGRST